MSMHIETFDDFLSTEHSTYYGDLPPFQFREIKSDEGTLQWLTQNFDAAVQAAQSRMIIYRRFHSLYKGIHWSSLNAGSQDRTNDDDYSRRKPRMTVNFIWEMVDTKVSQRGMSKIAVAVMPNNNEQDDINNAKACKLLLDGRSEMIDLDGGHTNADRIMFIYGHVFMFVLWDAETGDFHPEYKKLMEMYPKGFPKEVSNKLAKEGVFRIGDVIVRIMGPDRVFPQLGIKCKEDMDHIEYIEWVHIDQLKADYPKLAGQIKENQRQDFQYDLVDYEMRKKYAMVRHFYHRTTKHSPEGEYIKYTDDLILERKKLGFNHGKLPFVEDRDISVYGEYWGRSFLTNIEQLNRHFNNIESTIARNETVGSAPKWMMPKGAAKIASLNNEFTVVEFTGPIAPVLVTPQHTNKLALEQQDRLERKITQLSKVYDIQRGEVPSGVTANSALRFLDEQASQRDSAGVANRKKRVLDVYRMMLELMGQHYDESDDRTVRMLGKDNGYLIRSLKKADFSRTYDVKLLNSSALPDTKTGKISTIVDINAMTQTDPVFRREEIIQMMDLGMDDTFKNEATIAVTAAKTIIDRILNRDKDIPEPTEYDNYLVHYDMFNRTLQSATYRTSIDAETKAVFKQHIMVMEGMMWNRAKKNKAFALKLQTLDMYPIFFTPPAGESLDMVMASFMPPQMPAGGVQGPKQVAPPQQLETSKIQDSVDKAIQREQGE